VTDDTVQRKEILGGVVRDVSREKGLCSWGTLCQNSLSGYLVDSTTNYL